MEKPDRLEALSRMVEVLMMEVEALRAALLEVNPRAYAKAYRETALLTHNSAGPTSGGHKLAQRFETNGVPALYGEPLREVIMMARLGFTNEEIRRYILDAEYMGQLT
jgi:hypothetical protein